MRRGKIDHLVTTGKFDDRRCRRRQRAQMLGGLAARTVLSSAGTLLGMTDNIKPGIWFYSFHPFLHVTLDVQNGAFSSYIFSQMNALYDLSINIQKIRHLTEPYSPISRELINWQINRGSLFHRGCIWTRCHSNFQPTCLGVSLFSPTSRDETIANSNWQTWQRWMQTSVWRYK